MTILQQGKLYKLRDRVYFAKCGPDLLQASLDEMFELPDSNEERIIHIDWIFIPKDTIVFLVDFYNTTSSSRVCAVLGHFLIEDSSYCQWFQQETWEKALIPVGT